MSHLAFNVAQAARSGVDILKWLVLFFLSLFIIIISIKIIKKYL